ncbi:hypothetical protein HS125_02070 [bacterium]|nr:hypothetical protein [bacterium]
MKKLLALGILIVVGSVGYAYWHESRLVVMEPPWPEKVLLELRGAPGDVRRYETVVHVNVRSLAAGTSRVNDGTLTLVTTEEIGKQLGAGSHEVAVTFEGLQFDAPANQRAGFAFLGLGPQLGELKGQRISYIEHPTGRREMTSSALDSANNFVMQAFVSSGGGDLFLATPVGKGSAWETRIANILIKNQLADFETVEGRRCAKVTSRSETAAGEAPAAGGFQMEGNTTAYYDYSRGVKVREEGMMTITMPRQLTLNMTTTTRLVSDAPAAPAT